MDEIRPWLCLLDAFKEVKKRHPESMPHEPVWESL
jgi:hypothetical protein